MLAIGGTLSPVSASKLTEDDEDVVEGSSVVDPEDPSVPVAEVVLVVAVPLPVVPPSAQPSSSAIPTIQGR